MFVSSSRTIREEDDDDDGEMEGEEIEEREDHRRRSCGKGHNNNDVLETSEGGIICIACFSSFLSDPHSPSHHISNALSQLSSLLYATSANSLDPHHPRLLASPLVRALFCYNFTRHEDLSRQLVDLISLIASVSGRGNFISLIADQLSSTTASGDADFAWNRHHFYPLHCLGVLLNSKLNDGDLTFHIRNKMALFSNLVAGLRFPSEEIRGEILFVLYLLSNLQASHWDGSCDDNDGADSSSIGLKRLLLRLSLEALLKSQHDDVRTNCLALLTVLAQRGIFTNLLANDHGGRSFDETDNLMPMVDKELQPPLVNLFADAIKGPLLSSDTQVQISTLNLIFHYLSSDIHCREQVITFVEENIADYAFEILRLSGNKDPLVISCLQVLTLLATAWETFRQRLAIGFPTLLSVLHYVAEIPLHPVQSQVLNLVRRCILDCPGIISMPQIEEIAIILTKIFRRHTICEVDLHSETLILACSTFIEILKSPFATHMQKLGVMIQEASSNLILSSLSLPQGNSHQLLLYSLYLLKEAHAYSLHYMNSENYELEKSIFETCKIYLLPWLERAIDEGEQEETTLDVVETFHLILLRGSEVETHRFAEILASSSWFSFSFKCLGLFPSDEMKSRIYLMLSSVLDRIVGHESGHPIRDAYLHLPLDPLELLFLLGQRSSYDHDLVSCQRAVLLILYVSSLYGESLADDNQVLASLEQYVLVNSGNFTFGTADSVMLTQLVILYGLSRGTHIGHRTPYSSEAEKKLFHLIAEHEWDFLKMGVHPISVKWLFQQEEIMAPLSNQILNFCRLCSTKNTPITICASETHYMDVPAIAELVVSGDNNMTSLLVSLFKQVHEDYGEDDVISVANVIGGVIDTYPEASNQFFLQGICDALHGIYCSIHSTPHIFQVCSLLVFKILSSADHKTISEDGQWLAITLKLLEYLNNKLASHSCGEEGCLVIGIFCLILYNSTSHVLEEASMAILLNKSLVGAVDNIVSRVCAKGPSLVDSGEAGMGDCLIFVLLLHYFSIKSLHANFQGTLDWQDCFQASDDGVRQLSVICIKCHDLCRLIHFGSSLVKLVASQCLLEVLTRISDQNDRKHDKLRCSLNCVESMMAVTEGLVLYGDSTVAMNCAMCSSTMLKWEKLGLLQDTWVIKNSKWLRLIVEELVMTLAVPSLASRRVSNHHKPAALIAAALLRMDKIPQWITSAFDISCISGIVENISSCNVSAEMVMMLRELMIRKYTSTEQVAQLLHLFQVCRKQVYEQTSKKPFTKQSLGGVVGLPDDTGKVCGMLLHRMVYPLTDNDAIPAENDRLLKAIDMFFHEASTFS